MVDDPLDGTRFDVDYPQALLAALVVAVLVGLVVAASTSTAAFGAYNAQWDGASELRSQADAVGSESDIVRNTSAYAGVNPDETVALVLSPDREYTDRELARIRAFVQNGGTLVVAEDFGDGGNTLLRAVGATARFDGTILRDDRYNHRTAAFPIANNVTGNRTLTRGVDRLTLNYGTALDPGNATVLVRSSEFSYLDDDDDAEIDDNETLEQRPVATVERVGAGRVVVVSDPSLFINAMLERSGNQQFARNLFDSGDRVLLDYSHTASIPPLSLALLVLRDSALLQAGLGLVGIGAVVAWGRGLFDGVARRLRRDREDAQVTASAEDLAAYLEREHPEWDADRIERVVETVRRRE